ncbi:SDR family NAD(P)-dependent oxidoreductase [Amycolatopsis alkalitolerans]|uniref:SDR family NAD(P)-dependent oxidoreductase n=1 Tax=Amycolatopsis alkalitolerans TaxID=2547244 RepID=A0A5C4LPC7_9PSEU|nr:SDR family NAD(P)-dependent oxidoreductase [Amycolatopsis alkalitolerans]TNC19274.1 SDR family NAD(P)-dependent oxidoreductase [Amycolatopsis alkalitolerans]
MELDQRVALVSGGASGLGRAAVVQFIKDGARVAVLDADAASLASLCDSLGSRALALPADVSKHSEVETAMATLDKEFGRVDVCLNTVGIGPAGKVVRHGKALPLDEFRRVVEVNLIGLFDVMRLCAERMAANEPGIDNERGVIINVSSIAATQGQRGQVAYAASKAGLIGLMLPAARDLASLGIRVATITPGPFDTPLANSLPENILERVTDLVLYPCRRGDPQEFAALVQHIVENRFLNATVLSIDAGTRLI